MEINSIIGDYDIFYNRILRHLDDASVAVGDYPMSHLGYKAKTLEEYERIRDALLPHSKLMIENVHNGRPIAKIILRKPLLLAKGFSVSLAGNNAAQSFPG